MKTKFVCPRTNEVLTEEACVANYEYEACMGCTSQQDVARKALFDMLKKEYDDCAEFTMQEDGVLITVRDELRILADPGDWRSGTIVEIDCGKYGDTHTHPLDVAEWVKDFMEGRQVIMLSEDGMRSGNTHRNLFKHHPEELHKWNRIVDIYGTYTSQQYAERYFDEKKKTEYRFHCPVLNREVSTEECYERGKSPRTCYGEFCDHVANAVCRITYERLKECFGEQVSLELREKEGMLSIRFHEGLTLEVGFDLLFETLVFDVFLGNHGHAHDLPGGSADELVQMVGKLLCGEAAFVVRTRCLGLLRSIKLVDAQDLKRRWWKMTCGGNVCLIDGRGVCTKAEFEKWMKNSAS